MKIGLAVIRALVCALPSAMALWAAGSALAQTAAVAPNEADIAQASAPVDGVITYPASFFFQYRPSNAREMLDRVPGFRFDGGADVRGLGGAAGNVLIDGERPSSKSVSLDDVLRRLLPNQVLRIDLIRGAAPGVDMQGQAVVANVIRRPGADNSVAMEAQGEAYQGRPPGAGARLELGTRTHDVRLSGVLVAREEANLGPSGDGDFLRRDGGGALLATGRYRNASTYRLYQANGAAEFKDARLNLGYQREEVPRTEQIDLTDAAGGRNLQQTTSDETYEQYEIGADYQRQLGLGLTGRLIGLQTVKIDSQAALQTGSGAPSRSTWHSEADESILRATVRGQFHGVTLETGGEGAFNRLDAANTVAINGVPLVLPSANVTVEERRGEGFATLSAKPTSRLSLEGGVRVETSVIRQRGDANQSKSLTYAKPRFTAAYAVTHDTQLRARLERTVGQLDFGSFAASSDLASGSVNAGNAALVPQTAWESEIALERRFWNSGAIVLTATHSAVKGVVDFVPIVSPSGVFDAPGNLGDGTKDQLQADLTVPLERLGWKDASFRINWKWVRSRVTDPTTGLKRPFEDISPHSGSFLFTQNLPRWRSSFNIEAAEMGWIDRQYRNNEVRFDSETPYYLKVYWQYRPNPNWLLHVQLENPLARERRRERLIYAGPRATSAVSLYEQRSSQFDPFLMVKVRRVL